MQGFFAAQGLHGLQGFAAAQGLQGLHGFKRIVVAEQGLQGWHGFAAGRGVPHMLCREGVRDERAGAASAKSAGVPAMARSASMSATRQVK